MNMKVTVCFGNVRVVVPCGDGDLLVRDLIREATLRYKKATGKGTESWVAVHNLQSQSGGGILDPDDRLNDVADDREQIIANFEDGDGVHHGGGDGASGSSIGTASPDIFHDPEHKYTGSGYPSRTDIEVTGEQIASGILSVPLQVRRGSEPALHQLPTSGAEPPGPRPPSLHDPTKRWSAAPIILGDLNATDASPHIPCDPSSHTSRDFIRFNYGAPGYLSPDWTREHEKDDDDEDDDASFQRIARDGSNRLSMQFLGNGTGYRWADAAERTSQTNSTKHKIHVSTSLPRDHRRKEPLGQANNSTSPTPPPTLQNNRLTVQVNHQPETDEELAELIVIRNEPGPLGIHVVPDYDRLGKDRGLVVQGIEPGGRIDRDGKLAIHDRIIEINGQNLLNMSFQRVQEMFKLSLIATELRLKVVKHRVNGEQMRKPPAPVYPKTGLPVRFPEDKENVAMVEVEEQSVSGNTKLATVSPTKKLPSGTRNPKSLLTANTRKIGRKIELELTKGVHGLGFSITTRDNPAGGNCPIYIKNILPKGAAVEDGRLKPGDRLLEVNNVEMTGKSQAEAVAVLRNAPPGSKVRIVVSRQEEAVNGPILPREIGADDSEQARNSNTISIPVSKTNSLPITITPEPAPQIIHHQKSNSVNIVTSNTKPYPPIANNPSPPAIPPLPESMLSARNNKSAPERIGSVAKIISQFQEASKSGCNNHPSDKCNDDSLLFPWKHREILTFDIPVYDSEKAGLGVSVKGKTTQSSNGGSGSADLGIFVKSVLHGGAASRDKRLRTNDQLLNVNRVSLLQQSNAEAMETLRRAMLHTEGPVPGSITLIIARRAHSPAPPGAETNNGKGSNHWTSQGTQDREISINNHSSESNMESSGGTDNSGTSESSGNTVIFLPYKAAETSSQSLNASLQSPPAKNTPNYASNNWNPVIDRITGQSSKNHPHNNLQQLRNESYYMATHHDTWNTSMLMNTPNSDKYSSPTVNLPSGETVIIEEEYNPPPPIIRLTNSSSSNILENRNETEPDGKASVSSSTCGDKSTASGGAANSNTDVTYASQLSLENAAGFSRDAFGRQSMSEKRHATLDAKNTGTYQRNKKLREEREKMKPKDDADKLGQLGPSLGMKKSSSLESLQTMVQEIQMQEEEDPAYSYRGGPGALKVIRGRGCDESFRAAVDVDYNNHLDPNHRAETSAKKHWLLDPPEGHSGDVSNEREIDGFSNVRGGLRQSSLNAVLDSKHKVGGKKKPGILKGIGSMFRFGKHRKTESIILEQPLQHFEQTPEDVDIIQVHETQSQDVQTNKENEKQMNEQLQRSLRENHSSSSLASNKYYVRPDHETNELQTPTTSSPSRSEKVHQLRSQHQQRHAERHGQYPNDEREEHYEQVIRQRMEQPAAGYENYRQMGRPGSRSGIADPVRFNHYVNYDELQHQLSRKQHQYHSQRQPRSELQQRPVSNFYEYESIQSFMHSRGRLPPSHVPSPQPSPSVTPEEVNSNSLPRYHQVVGSRHQHHHNQLQPQNNNNSAFTQHQRVRPYQSNPSATSYHHPPPPQYHQPPQSSQSPRYVQQNTKQHSMQINGRHRGPFVTHVTIGNDGNNKATGSKV